MREKPGYRELLGLLPVFDAVFTSRSVSHAAEKLGLSQSAVSQCLTRLRTLLSDELFIRTGHGVRPTPKAEQIAHAVQALLRSADTVLNCDAFDPLALRRRFVLDVRGGFDAMVVPPLIQDLRQSAPHVAVTVRNGLHADMLKDLTYGETDLAFDFRAPQVPGFRSQGLVSDPTVVISRRNHPGLAAGLTADDYQNLPHAGLAWHLEGAESGVKVEQTRLQVAPELVVVVPTISGLALVVEQTDLIATVARVVAMALQRRHAIDIHPMPFRFSQLSLFAVWHKRHDADQAHHWFRNTLLTSLAARAASVRSASVPLISD